LLNAGADAGRTAASVASVIALALKNDSEAAGGGAAWTADSEADGGRVACPMDGGRVTDPEDIGVEAIGGSGGGATQLRRRRRK
jgi:hypothetical protein